MRMMMARVLFGLLCWCASLNYALVVQWNSLFSRSTRTRRFTTVSVSDDLPAEVLSVLTDVEAGPHGVAGVLRELLYSCRIIGSSLRDGAFSALLTGTENAFGDKQLDVDVQADAVLFAALARSGLVHVAASEECPVEVACGGTGYSVAFDPLDGSSVVDCNFAVGTIAGVWPGNGLLNRRGREQVHDLSFLRVVLFPTCTLTFDSPVSRWRR